MTDLILSTFSRGTSSVNLRTYSVAGVEHDVRRRIELFDDAVLHDRDAVGQAQGFVEVVGYEQDGLAEDILQAQKFVLHLLADQRVERGKGFVEKPDVGFDRKRAGDADALLLAARKLSREIVFAATVRLTRSTISLALCMLSWVLTPLTCNGKGDIFQHGFVR